MRACNGGPRPRSFMAGPLKERLPMEFSPGDRIQDVLTGEHHRIAKIGPKVAICSCCRKRIKRNQFVYAPTQEEIDQRRREVLAIRREQGESIVVDDWRYHDDGEMSPPPYLSLVEIRAHKPNRQICKETGLSISQITYARKFLRREKRC